ncbi:hypothetical protein [Phytohabitans rumicis]|uniref:Uncharacterized protein n=1 Tax=Phytohabitans rumicis TaxID=1076125 RepID=A0A6V8LKY3_9ACTN|nr:hypothetical protein [Phytohabitans rumicis]GFJ93305.1 hypothetical protein Prum_069470 [Phytohabitans rumicis]
MGKHEVPETKRSLSRRAAQRALHPATHVITLITLHVVALGILGVAEKLPLLTTLLH